MFLFRSMLDIYIYIATELRHWSHPALSFLSLELRNLHHRHIHRWARAPNYSISIMETTQLQVSTGANKCLLPRLTGQTLRVWIPNSREDIMKTIEDKGLTGAVLEAVLLDDNSKARSMPQENMIVVDLAVAEHAMAHVHDQFSTVPLPLSDVSLIVLAQDSEVPERRTLLRHYLVYKNYLQQFAKRHIREMGSNSVDQWYAARLSEISDDIKKCSEKL